MIRDEIADIIKKTITRLAEEKTPGFDAAAAATDFSVEYCRDVSHGHYATNVALRLAAAGHKNPLDIASIIVAKMEEAALKDYFRQIDAAGPGFINLSIAPARLQKELGEVLKQKEKYGRFRTRRLKTQVEFISANPNGQMHVGNGRGAFFGDVLSNVLARAGYDVEREYYVNDAKVSKQIQELGKTALGQGQSYLTPYLKDLLTDLKPELSKFQSETDAGYYLAGVIMKELKKFITRDLGIRFDQWVSEESLFRQSWIMSTYDMLKKRGKVFEKDDAYWLDMAAFNQKDEVLLRKNGQPTYFLSDIAYHRYKIERGYKKIIDVWGADHQGHVPRMKAVMAILGYVGEFDVLISQIVNLKGGKMSKRSGTIVPLEWLIKEVGVDAARFFYLEKSLNAQMEFDVELAKEKSEKSPVFYVQYAYARIAGILRKAGARAKRSDRRTLSLLIYKSEIELIRELLRFPEIVCDTARDFQVQRLFAYAQEVAATFHKFYGECRVISNDQKLTSARLQLVLATRIVLKNTFDLMGVSAPEKM